MDWGWTDYVPGLHSIHDAAQGNWGAAAGHLGADVLTGGLYSPVAGAAGKAYDWYKSGFDEQKAGYLAAAAAANKLAEQSKATQQEGLSQAEAYYKPAQAMYAAAYGSPGMLRK